MEGPDAQSYMSALLALLPEDDPRKVLLRQHEMQRNYAMREQRILDVINGQGGFQPNTPGPDDQFVGAEDNTGIRGGRINPRYVPAPPAVGQGVSGRPDAGIWAHNRRVMAGRNKNVGRMSQGTFLNRLPANIEVSIPMRGGYG